MRIVKKGGSAMAQVTLGKTGIVTEKNAFGCLPIQRISKTEAAYLLQKAFHHGITFFDTARMYSDSEEKIGYALHHVRDKIYLATKTQAKTADVFWVDLETSLRNLRTDYIDLYQFHNPPFCPIPGDGTGLYEAALKAQAQGKIRHIGITNHRQNVAHQAIDSCLYASLQFPFCYLASAEDMEIVSKCQEKQLGFIAMKALSGGLINNAAAAYAWLAQFEHVLPIWGIQREKELDEFLSFMSTPPTLSTQVQQMIQKDRSNLLGSFCRGCGYCMPCPVGIEINNCARMSLMMRRSPTAPWLSESNQAKMHKIKDCLNCGQCKAHCPYGLDTPTLLRENYQDYLEILGGKHI